MKMTGMSLRDQYLNSMDKQALIDQLLWGFEVHSPEKIRACIEQGLDVNKPIKGRRPVDILIQMYLRSDRLGACLQLLIDAGAEFEDPLLMAVLMDDDRSLDRALKGNVEAANARYSFPCAFTSLQEASLLHISAEYGRHACTRLLLECGMDPNVRAGFDEQGFGGQSPIFHTVNSNRNYCRPVMDLLLAAGASLDIHLKGVVWGKGMEWETLIPGINPVSFAMMGNLPQFHRDEADIADNIRALMYHQYSTVLQIPNVPNAYVARSKEG